MSREGYYSANEVTTRRSNRDLRCPSAFSPPSHATAMAVTQTCLRPTTCRALAIWTPPIWRISRTRAAITGRLGCALQLTTVRLLGTFLDDPVAVPHPVIQTLATPLDIGELDTLLAYRDVRLPWAHTVEIRSHDGYREFVDPLAGFRLARWLYALCWTGTERPSV
jgi:hypothetical protein